MWWHVLPYTGFADIDAQLQQFAVMRSAPTAGFHGSGGGSGHGPLSRPPAGRVCHARTFHVKKRRQARMVSGLTMTRAEHQSLQTATSQDHSSRSGGVSLGRLAERWRTRVGDATRNFPAARDSNVPVAAAAVIERCSTLDQGIDESRTRSMFSFGSAFSTGAVW